MPPRLPSALPRCLRSQATTLPVYTRSIPHHYRPEPRELLRPAAHTQWRVPRRAFTTSSARGLNITNPRGPEHTIEITPRAVARLKALQEQDANPSLALRITVESGGCHGFQYNMSLSDQVDAQEDTVFEEDGAMVVMDEPSLELLKGSKVDYTMELIGSQFKIVDNPEATSSCGCGTSFDIKGF